MDLFNSIYVEKIVPVLEELEKKRILTHKKIIRGEITLVIVLLVILVLAKENWILVLIFIMVLGPVALKAIKIYVGWDYTKEFKRKVLKPLIVSIGENFHYKPEQSFPRFLFKRSRLFGYYTHYFGDDLVKGKIKDIRFMFSELHVYEKRKVGKNEVVVDVFQGIFAQFDFNKNFESTLLIYPDVAEKYFGYFGKWLQKLNFKQIDLVYLDNPEFEKHFVVYGDDPIEARYLLTHTMMESIMKFYKQVRQPLYISLSSSKLYIAIEYGNQDHFEPQFDSSLLRKENLYHYFQKVYDISGVVETFRLNQFLWSKYPPQKPIRKTEQNTVSELEKKINNSLIKKENIQESIQTRENLDAVIYDEYYEKIKNTIKSVERKRYLTIALESAFLIVVTLIYGAVLIYSNKHFNPEQQGSIYGIGILMLFGVMYVYYYIASFYTQVYTNILVKPLLQILNKTLQYSPNSYLKEDFAYASQLFRDWDNYSGDNFFSCNFEKLKTIASQLNIQDDNQKIFHGYFFVIEYATPKNESFRCFPKGKSYDIVDALPYKHFENFTSQININRFKYHFSIYSESKGTIKLISEEFAINLVNMKKELNIDAIYISHQENKLMFAFDFGKRTLFDASLMNSAHNHKDMRFFITLYKSVEHLLRCLKKR